MYMQEAENLHHIPSKYVDSVPYTYDYNLKFPTRNSQITHCTDIEFKEPEWKSLFGYQTISSFPAKY